LIWIKAALERHGSMNRMFTECRRVRMILTASRILILAVADIAMTGAAAAVGAAAYGACAAPRCGYYPYPPCY
jgi:hypothetical protein